MIFNDINNENNKNNEINENNENNENNVNNVNDSSRNHSEFDIQFNNFSNILLPEDFLKDPDLKLFDKRKLQWNVKNFSKPFDITIPNINILNLSNDQIYVLTKSEEVYCSYYDFGSQGLNLVILIVIPFLFCVVFIVFVVMFMKYRIKVKEYEAIRSIQKVSSNDSRIDNRIDSRIDSDSQSDSRIDSQGDSQSDDQYDKDNINRNIIRKIINIGNNRRIVGNNINNNNGSDGSNKIEISEVR